jgi:hypothetical protein
VCQRGAIFFAGIKPRIPGVRCDVSNRAHSV